MSDFDEHGRPEPPQNGGELETLVGFVDFLRATVAWKCSGLDSAGLRTTVGSSSMTLGGLLKHLAYVEDHWFSRWLHDNQPAPPWDTVDWDADRDWDWNSAAEDTPDELLTLWHQTVDRSREQLAQALATGGLGAMSLTIGDIDADGNQDLITASYADNKISWFQNDGAATPTFSVRRSTA